MFLTLLFSETPREEHCETVNDFGAADCDRRGSLRDSKRCTRRDSLSGLELRSVDGKFRSWSRN